MARRNVTESLNNAQKAFVRGKINSQEEAATAVAELEPQTQEWTPTITVAEPDKVVPMQKKKSSTSESLSPKSGNGETLTRDELLGTPRREQQPIRGLVGVTIRLKPELVEKLREVSTQRTVSREFPYAQQDVAAEALVDWFEKTGYMK